MERAVEVLVYPRDPAHRLVGPELVVFLDRLCERIVALGDGATARLKAGPCRAEAETLLELTQAIDEARVRCRGREDLELRIAGDARPAFARFTGGRTLEAVFAATVRPRPVDGGALACWTLRLRGPDGRRELGDRFQRERRRLGDGPFLEALAGSARTVLEERHLKAPSRTH
ncbi:MAG: hypothetical protein D6731_20910 [Planctomycetota bacterium]|nr:MAG: hypothetical protein D6731_20910 [Planctomycetota bacterium]